MKENHERVITFQHIKIRCIMVLRLRCYTCITTLVVRDIVPHKCYNVKTNTKFLYNKNYSFSWEISYPSFIKRFLINLVSMYFVKIKILNRSNCSFTFSVNLLEMKMHDFLLFDAYHKCTSFVRYTIFCAMPSPLFIHY